MSVNIYKPHVIVLPEDDANSDIANGIYIHHSVLRQNLQILGSAGGWSAVVDRFIRNEVPAMTSLPKRHVVLLIDFDNQVEERLAKVKSKIPDRLVDRVFVLGVSSEPEDLKRSMGSYEHIGLLLAQECLEQTSKLWNDKLLRHNAPELVRLRESVRPILFDSLSGAAQMEKSGHL